LPNAGGAFKCTFCYDRQKSGLTPACAKVCPTESIVFGRLDDLRARGSERVRYLRENGYTDAQLYDPQDTSVGGIHAFFLLLGEPEPYGLPPKPEGTNHLPEILLARRCCNCARRDHNRRHRFCLLRMMNSPNEFAVRRVAHASRVLVAAFCRDELFLRFRAMR
jgi:hypothetical protein